MPPPRSSRTPAARRPVAWYRPRRRGLHRAGTGCEEAAQPGPASWLRALPLGLVAAVAVVAVGLALTACGTSGARRADGPEPQLLERIEGTARPARSATRPAAPPGEPPGEPTSRERVWRAVDLYSDRRYAEALREFIGVYLDSPLPRLHFNIGRCYERLNQHREALRSYERFLATDPDLTPALRSEAEGSVVRMRQLIAPQLLAPQPSNGEDAMTLLSRMHRATGLYERRRYQPALDEFIAAFLEAPLPRLHLHIARCQDKLGRPAEALRAYERLLRSDPNLSPELRSEALEARERLRQRASSGDRALHRDGRFWGGLLGGMAAVGLAVGLGIGLGTANSR